MERIYNVLERVDIDIGEYNRTRRLLLRGLRGRGGGRRRGVSAGDGQLTPEKLDPLLRGLRDFCGRRGRLRGFCGRRGRLRGVSAGDGQLTPADNSSKQYRPL